MMEGPHKVARRRSYSSLQYTANWSMIMSQAAWMRQGTPEALGALRANAYGQPISG
jgi:hypothetical protein